MKNILFALIAMIMASEAHALTLDDCNRYSTAQIAGRLLHSIALGAQTGTGNRSCIKQAQNLDVSLVSEEFYEARFTYINDKKDYTLVSVEEPSELNHYRPTAKYTAITPNGKRVEGSFKFRRHEYFLDPSSIIEDKCASITTPPDTYLVLKSCH